MFGTAGVVAVAGGVCGAVVPGLIGQLLTFVLIALGLGAAVLLLFLEVGLSEDRARARDEARQRQRSSPRSDEPAGSPPHSPRRPRRLRE
jgi:fucose permease